MVAELWLALFISLGLVAYGVGEFFGWSRRVRKTRMARLRRRGLA